MKKIQSNKIIARILAIMCVAALLMPMCVSVAAGQTVTLNSAVVGEDELTELKENAPIIAAGSVINISGIYSLFGGEVTFLVIPDGSVEPIRGIGQTTSSETDGSFEYAIGLPVSMDAGTYMLKVGGEQVDEPVIRYFKTVVGLEKSIVLTSEAESIKTLNATLAVSAEIVNAVAGDRVVWSVSSGSDVVSVDDNGVVTALKEGVAVVRASLFANPEVYAEKTITVDTAVFEDVSFTVSITGAGTVNATGAYTGTIVGAYTASYPVGSMFELEAVTSGNDVFLHWIDDRSGRIISDEPVLPVGLGINTSIRAVFKSETDTAYVMFVEKNKHVRLSGHVDENITVPEDPYAMGYMFKNWVKDNEEQSLKAGDIIAAGTYSENTIFNAKHEKRSDIYRVTFAGVSEFSDGIYNYQYNNRIDITPAEATADKKFAYWKKDGAIVSYSYSYTFYVPLYDIKVEAVFVDKDEVVATVPALVMAEPQTVQTNKIAFFAERFLPEQYTMLETGIILSDDTTADLTLENAKLKAVSTSTANNGQYTVRKANVTENEKWLGRAYMVYKDGNNIITIYSNTVTGQLQEIIEDMGDVD